MRTLGKRLIIILITVACVQHAVAYAATNVSLHKLSVKENIQKNLPSTVTIHLTGDESSSLGSGAIVSSDGSVVTCYHVIDDIREGIVRLPNGTIHRISEILAVDPLNDIALIKIEGPSFKPIKLADSAKVELGDEIVVIGSPQFQEATVSTGIISSVHRDINQIQFTAPISSGSSGGPLFNAYGELIGITRSSITQGQNLNFAVPSSEIAKLLTPINTKPFNSQIPLKASFDQALGRYLIVHNNDDKARIAAAEFYIKRGNADKVLELTNNQESSDKVVYLRAKAHFLKNNAETATELFDRLPEHYFHKEPRLYLFQASLLLKNHELQKAKTALEKYNVHSSEKDALYYYTVGDLSTAYAFTESRQLDQDQYYEKAIGFYEIAATKDSRFVNAIYKKGLIQLTMGDLNSANETYNELHVKDTRLAQSLEGKIINTVNAYKTARANYYRELGKEQMIDNLSLLLYSIIAIIQETGFYYHP